MIVPPSFFIVGAPKCGTTAMGRYLAAHPDVFMSVPKEPFFFATDLPGMRKVTSQDAYLELFSQGAGKARLSGEASTLYLFSKEAVANIQQFDPASRLIVMLRNPVELVHAFHGQLLYGFFEDEPDFTRAWDLQEARAGGASLPSGCREPALLQYASVGALGSQVQRLLDGADRDRILFLIFDDLVRDPAGVYAQVLRFLGLPHDGRTDFPRQNPSQAHRFRSLSKLKTALFRRSPLFERAFWRVVRGAGLEAAARKLVVRPRPRTPLPSETRSRLLEWAAPEIETLARSVNRDLSHWLEEKPR